MPVISVNKSRSSLPFDRISALQPSLEADLCSNSGPSSLQGKMKARTEKKKMYRQREEETCSVNIDLSEKNDDSRLEKSKIMNKLNLRAMFDSFSEDRSFVATAQFNTEHSVNKARQK